MIRNLKYILALIGLAVLAFLIMDFTNRVSEANRLQRKKVQVEQQIIELNKTQVYLQTQVAIATAEPAVWRYVYEEKQEAQPGDIRVVPIPLPIQIPSPTPTPIIPLLEYSNWQYWWALFFDPGS
jgi:hypothetical protein